MMDRFDSMQWTKLIGKNICKLNDVDVILSPITRFFTAFAFLILLVALQHIVVFGGVYQSSDKMTKTELAFIAVSAGFVMAEVEELYSAVRERRLAKYWQGPWNYVDWAMDSIFIVYLYLRLGAKNSYDA